MSVWRGHNRKGIALPFGMVITMLMLAALTMRGAHAATAGPYTIGLEPSYFAGNFGTANRIRIYDVPLTLQYRRRGWRVRVEIPYISIAGAGVVVGNTIVPGNEGSAARGGPGDIWVEVEYRLDHARGGLRPAIEPYLKVKIPVASYNQGLGTGRFDEEGGLLLTWRAMARLFPYVRLGYRHVGRVPGLNLRNIVTFEPGVTTLIAPRQYVSALIVGHTPIAAGLSTVASAILVYDLRMNSRWEFQAYVARGLTAESAAFGAGLGVKAHF